MFAEYVVRVSCFFAAPLPDSALFGELVPIYARISVKVHTCMRARLRAVSFFFGTILIQLEPLPFFTFRETRSLSQIWWKTSRCANNILKH